MSTTYHPPIAAGPGQPPPEPWFGPGDPSGPGGPAGYGGGGEGPAKPTRRFRRGLLAAGVVGAVGLAAWGLSATGVLPGHRVLTTSQIAAQTDPGLVDIYTNLGYQNARAAGTGMVLTSSGEVLTNNHVINGATSIKARDIGNGRTYQAKVVGYDHSHDIAVIQLQAASGLDTVTLGDSDSVAPGQKVVALGNALGKGGTPSVATGHVASLGASITASDEGAGTSEQLTGLIHHNAGIQPGDSGGPLVNTTGQIIGINTAASQGTQIQGQQTQAFAIPINQAVSIAHQIETRGASATVHIGPTAFLGVAIMSASDAAANGAPAGAGASVAGTVPGAPAAGAGLTQGDVIVSVNGQRISSPEALQSALGRHHPGDSVTISWQDTDGQAQSATVTLANGPAA
jgi:S1-C subfamily serine protease